MRKILSLSGLLLAITFVIVNCTKEGPAGPAGPAGPQGNPGLTGPVGPAGPAGSANVIYSPWFSPTAWTTPGLSFSNHSFDRAAPGVTASIITSGVVLSYVQVSGDGTATRILPAIYQIGANQGIINFLIPAAGTIRYTIIDPSSAIFGAAPGLGFTFRYIIIPGSVLGGRTRDPRTMTYQEVCQAYGIPE